jgi:UDP-2,4-diacetamido-2,4,6-trideoxy-beta-L-altropyranose hydrolase
MSLGGLIIRVDAGAAIGAGHVMRCLGLAQAWRKSGGSITFLMASTTTFVSERLSVEGFEVLGMDAQPGSLEDAVNTRSAASQLHVQWLVLDGYHFNADYCAAVVSAEWRILRVEDMPGSEFHLADVILNQNLHAEGSLYPKPTKSKYPEDVKSELLLGPRYALLRDEFVDACQLSRKIPTVASAVLITTGGGDPTNLLQRLVDAINFSSLRLDVKVVVGTAPEARFLHSHEMEPRSSIQLVVGSRTMSQLVAWADIAISAAGSTCWEFCALGLPSILIDVAENQRPLADSLSQRGIAAWVPLKEANSERLVTEIELLIQSPERREAMSRRGKDLVDGRGAQRVVSALRAFGIKFRRATQEDCCLLWNWANDTATRAASFRSAAISWDEHREWFNKNLANDGSFLLIAEESRTPIATIRVQKRKSSIGELSITLAPEVRGSGLATHLIRHCEGKAATELGLSELDALIKPENLASRRAFENAGYAASEKMQIGEASAIRYVRQVVSPKASVENVPVQAAEC